MSVFSFLPKRLRRKKPLVRTIKESGDILTLKPMTCVSTGSKGLDEMLKGGIPAGHTVLLLAPSGAGKTSLCLQYINEGLENGENCFILTLEESIEDILTTADNYGWSLIRKCYAESLKKKMKPPVLFISKLDPRELGQSGVRKFINYYYPLRVAAQRCTRIIIDPFSVFAQTFPDISERREIVTFMKDQLKPYGATAIYTGESEPTNAFIPSVPQLEYALDGIIVLIRSQDEKADRMTYRLAIAKMRRTGHSKAIVPYTFGKGGIKIVYDEKDNSG